MRFWPIAYVMLLMLSAVKCWRFPKALLSGPNISRATRRNIKLLFVLTLLGVETTEEVYVRLPQAVIYGSTPRRLTPQEFNPGVDENIAIIFPGAGGPDVFTQQLMSSIQREDKKYGIRRKVSVPLHLATKSFLRNDHILLILSLNI